VDDLVELRDLRREVGRCRVVHDPENRTAVNRFDPRLEQVRKAAAVVIVPCDNRDLVVPEFIDELGKRLCLRNIRRWRSEHVVVRNRRGDTR